MKRTPTIRILLVLHFLTFSSCFAAADRPFKYAGIFTREIYDQSGVVRLLNGVESHDKPIIEAYLTERKRACVQQYVQRILDQRSEWYQAKFAEAEESVAQEGRAIGQATGSKKVGEGLGPISFLSKLTSMITHKIIEGDPHAHEVKQATAQASLQYQISELSKASDELKRLDFYRAFMGRDENLREPYLWDYEVRYLSQKRFMQKSVSRAIEDILLYAREASLSERLKEKVDALMRIPYRLAGNIVRRAGSDQSGYAASLSRVRDRFYADSKLAALGSESKKRLWDSVVRDLAMTTATSSGGGALRHCFYFYGPPGTGKSYTARGIADFLGWLSYCPVLLAETDFSRATLYGTSSEPGVMLSTYTRPEERRHRRTLNAILILDDFDRLLLGDNPAHCTAALSFLQSFLDRNLMSIVSPYVGGEIDISRLSVIITGNSNLVDACARRGGEYEAILSRLRLFKFTSPNKDTVVTTLTPAITTLLGSYRLQGDERILSLLKEYIKSDRCPTDLRQAFDKHVITIVNQYLENPAEAERLFGPQSRSRVIDPRPSVRQSAPPSRRNEVRLDGDTLCIVAVCLAVGLLLKYLFLAQETCS